jgi:hypothetical protein
MNEKLQNDLVKAYPKIFKNIGGDKAMGIQCNDGWYDLLDSLCYRISVHCTAQNTRYIVETDKYEFVLEGDPEYMQVVAAQIKEKMGELRFYTDGGDATTEGMIQMAEQMSTRICELCGSPAKTSRDSGWWHTTCDACNKRIRLDRQGWRSGSAEEFLADTDSAASQSHCHSCGVPWESHIGIAGTCAENAQLRKGLKEAKEGKFSKTPPKIKPKKKKTK